MSLDYLGAEKKKAHENEQDEKIASGGGNSVEIITTDQFVVDQTLQFPLPVIDDIKEPGRYIILLDVTSAGIPGKILFRLDVAGNGQSIITQVLSLTLPGFIFLQRDFNNNAWGSWKLQNEEYCLNFLNKVRGYDEDKTQVLKNVNGVIQWVDEA